MFALIESKIIYRRAEQGILNFLVNPLAIFESRRYQPTENSGVVFLNQKNKDLIKHLPDGIATAIRNPKGEAIEKTIHGDEIFVIETGVLSSDKIGVCKVFEWGFRYITGSKMGFWQFEWGRFLIRFSGRRNSFLSGTNGLFSYKSGEFKVLRFLTSELEKPLVFQDVEIKPDEVVRATPEEEKWEFYLPLKRRELIT